MRAHLYNIDIKFEIDMGKNNNTLLMGYVVWMYM